MRTLLAVLGLCAAVLFAPLWVQILLLMISVVIAPYRIALLIPAVLSDVLYRPQDEIALRYSFSTLFVVGVLVVYWLIITKTRVTTIVHGLEKK